MLEDRSGASCNRIEKSREDAMSVTFPNESDEHRRARTRLLDEEIALRRAMESVAVARRALPPGGEVPEDYTFDGLDQAGQVAKIRLSELFADNTDTLIVYHFMFPRHANDNRPQPSSGSLKELPKTEGPCPSCTALLDQLNGAATHVQAAGVNFAVVAKAPITRVVAFARDRGWDRLRMLSASGNTFKRDYRGEDADGQQMPMLSVFQRRSDGRIRHFWSSELLYAPTDPGQDPRHAGTIEPLWNLLDFTPSGRPRWEEQLEYPCCHGTSARKR
jgi:predicted dithiol-disulfide oxidoreductase (DUF899 family)